MTKLLNTMNQILTINCLRKLAKKKTPKMFYEYMTAGSWTEETLRANYSDFKKIKFRQRVVKDISSRRTESRLIGIPSKMPVALAPCGLTGMQFPDGEIHAAKAAEKFGVPFTLSTMSNISIEDLAKHVNNPFWFQLYVMKDHQFSKNLIKRAKDVNCSALILTVDLQLLGQRHCDILNGLSSPPKITMKNLLDIFFKPRWALGMIKTRRKGFGNIVGHVEGVSDNSKLSAWIDEQFDLKLSWDDISRIRDWWNGKFIIKGILDAEDALLAQKIGADAIIVSNHGGRQLDQTVSTISVLPEIVATLNQKTEVWLDSGILSGQDILKSIALGANATMIGKSYLYGLAAGGEKGVTKALEILHKELDKTMGLCGCKKISEVNKNILRSYKFD